MQHDCVLKKLNFDLLTPRVGSWRCGQKHLVPCCYIDDSIQFDMQHEHVLKGLTFDLLAPMVVEVGASGQNIYYHVAAFMIPCNMTMF